MPATVSPDTPRDAPARSTGQPRRFYELDSLRGLAALSVVLSHFNYIVPQRLNYWMLHTPLRVLVAGHQAVMLFFVLSGFVLTLPYLRRSALDYPAFLIKRVCRIYLPYLVALALAIAGDHYTRPMVSSNGWINATWSEPVTRSLVMQHVLFLGSYDFAQFNTAFWSLVYEMRVSLVFPFLALAVVRWRLRMCVLLMAGLWAVSLTLTHFLPRLLHFSRDTVGDWMETIFYAALFVLGGLLARNLERIERWFDGVKPAAIAGVGLAALVLYAYVSPLNPIPGVPFGCFEVLAALGAAGFIVLGIHCGPIQRFLTVPIVHHLGKVSYSLYLVHGTVLFLLIHTVFGRIPLAAMFVLYLGMTFAVTEVFYRFVERPTMKLGRRLTTPRRSALAQVLT